MKNKRTFSIIALVALLSISFATLKDQYILDKGHTYIGFDVERFMVGEVTGRFNEFSGTINMEGDDISTLNMEIKIATSSLDTNNEVRDGHLKGENWLDTESYPEIIFKSKEVLKKDNENYIIKGDMTIHGVTNEIEFPVEILGPFKDPTQKLTIGIKADFEIDRFDYGIQFNRKMDNGVLFIDNKVKIKIRALAQKA
ncbi:YceI family protein [Leptobacterium sp. I13]|uniref:YceI family protein n=1 Tax=Leptobacterium meishanense TaxID=3128904 RepID=UPI0030EF17EE